MTHHRKTLFALVLLLAGIGVGLAPELRAQDAPAAVTFDFQDADLRVVLSALAEAAGLNIVYGELPAKRVTLRTSKSVTVSEVRGLLENVARTNGLTLVEEAGLLRVVVTDGGEGVVRERAAQPPRARPRLEERRLFVHSLRHARAETIVQTLRSLFGLAGGSSVTAYDENASLSEALRDQRLAADRQTDRLLAGAQPRPPTPRAAEPSEGEDRGVAVEFQHPVDMVPDPLSNAILILATPADYDIVSAAIQQIDARPLQVMIEVLIAEVRLNNQNDLGVDVNIPLKEGDDDGVTFNLTGLSAGDVALSILGIGTVGADVVLRALASVGDVTILSRPILLAQNNQQARILVGDQRPFIQLFRALPTDAAVRDQVVQYRNVGTQLSIRPTINADGFINLSVLQEVSTATAETQFGAPIINTREAETDLLVKDGQTVVLGGLINYQEETTHSGIPLLKDIPLLGMLFRSTRTQKIQTELLLMITTHVIRTEDDLDETSQRLIESTRKLQERLPDPIPLLPPLEPAPDSMPLPERTDTLPGSAN